jgi:hypothetical protein
MKNHFILLVLLLFTSISQAANILGTVKDNKGELLPFVTIYIEQVGNKTFTRTTVTNTDGKYAINLPDGNYSVAFRFLGYKAVTENVTLAGKDHTLNIVLEAESISLKEVEISAQREDPAYEIIRNAQEKRKFYLEQAPKYTAKAYIKGLQRVDDAPKKVMGRDITIPGAEGDTTNRGIVYLSESLSELYFDKPKGKEIMIASKVSGRSNSFSWNSALEFDINLYKSSIDMGGLSPRSFISPIAPTSMLHYRYEYLGTVQEKGLSLHKIKLIPKQKGSPVFFGTLYIQDGDWRVHSTELIVTKAATGVDFVDSLTIQQNYVPIDEKIWKLGTQSANFKWSVSFLGLKFKGSGYFVGTFSEYNLNPKIDNKIFSGESVKILEESNKKDTAFWSSVRPFELTEEETKDYVRKDSIYKVRDSKEFKDSLDRKNNKFKLWSILMGYSYRNSYDNWRIETTPLLNAVQVNTVEGIVLNLGINYFTANKERYKIFSINNDIRYGFASEKLYFQTNIYRRFNGTNRLFVRLQGGSYIFQYNDQNPISTFVNTTYTTSLKENWAKFYEKQYAKFSIGGEVTNGIFANTSVEYARRSALRNTEQKGYYFDWYPNKSFISNNPQNELFDFEAFQPHNAIFVDAELTFKFGQKYISRPYLKINQESVLPVLKVYYKKGLGATDFDFLRATVTDDMNLGQLGRGEYILQAGKFLNTNKMYFIDYAHFNTTQTLFSNNRLDAFFLLPYYNPTSTNDVFVEAHYEQHFNGFLTNRIGFLRKLGWSLVAGGHYLGQNGLGNYGEVTLGIENIFRVLRVDVAYSMSEQKRFNHQWGFRLRTTLF